MLCSHTLFIMVAARRSYIIIVVVIIAGVVAVAIFPLYNFKKSITFETVDY